MSKAADNEVDILIRKDPSALIALLKGESGVGQPPVDAAGNGVADDTAFVAAQAAKGVLVLPLGKTYRLTSSIPLGKIDNQGGFLFADGVAVDCPYDQVTGPKNVRCFKGTGKFTPRNQVYSIGHYDGACYGEKFEFASRSMIKDAVTEVWMPTPEVGDPAMALDDNGAPRYRAKVAVELLFNDKQNNCTYHLETKFWPVKTGTTRLPCVFRFSVGQKTEDIHFRGDFDVDGGWAADYGIISHGGSRMCWYGKNKIQRVAMDGILLDMSDALVADASQIEWMGLWEISQFGRRMITVRGYGTGTSRVVLQNRLGKFMTNGARGVYGTVTVVAGAVTAFTPSATGPGGQTQPKFGYTQGQELLIAAMPTATGKAGKGAKITINTNSFGDFTTVLAVTAGGAAYNDGDAAWASACDQYIKFEGATRECSIECLEATEQPEINHLYQPIESLSAYENTNTGSNVGGSQGLLIKRIVSRLGNRPLFVAKDSSAGVYRGSVTVLDWVINALTYDSSAYFDLRYTLGGALYGNAVAGTNTVALIDASTTDFHFVGIDRLRVSGNGGVTFDGRRIQMLTSLADDAITSFRARPVAAVSLMTLVNVTVRKNLTPFAAYHAVFGVTEEDGAKLLSGDSTYFEGFTGNVLGAGTGSGTDGKFGLQYNQSDGNLTAKNRLGEAVRTTITVANG